MTYGLISNGITAKWIADVLKTAGYPGQPARFTLDRVIELRRERLLSEYVDSDVVSHEA